MNTASHASAGLYAFRNRVHCVWFWGSFRLLCLIFALVFLALLSGCAGFDASVLDTATCMGKGKFSTGLVYGIGINAPQWLEIDPENIFDSDSAGPLQALELKYGVQEDMDATAKMAVHVNGFSVKGLLKKQLFHENRVSTAVAIGGGYLASNGDYWKESFEAWDVQQSNLLSAEAQFLATREFGRNSYVTLATRANVHRFEAESDDGRTRSEDFHHAGIRLNAGRAYGGFLLMFELGLEAPLSAGEIKSVYPWAGYKMAWLWNTK